MISVLFVCLGNICRSPTAEAVVKRQLCEAGCSDLVRVDSAGTADWHIGKTADLRTQAAAIRRGYDMSCMRGRQVKADDFYKFDYILAMDESNLANLKSIEPKNHDATLALFLDYSPLNGAQHNVPDPYYGGEEGFDVVLDLIEDAGRGLISDIQSEL